MRVAGGIVNESSNPSDSRELAAAVRAPDLTSETAADRIGGARRGRATGDGGRGGGGGEEVSTNSGYVKGARGTRPSFRSGRSSSSAFPLSVTSP